MESILNKIDKIDALISETNKIISDAIEGSEAVDYSTPGKYSVTFSYRSSDKRGMITKVVEADSIPEAITTASISEDAPFPSVLSSSEYTVTGVELISGTGGPTGNDGNKFKKTINQDKHN